MKNLLRSRGVLIALFWLTLAAAFIPQFVIMNLSRPDPESNWMTCLRGTSFFLLWALFTPIVFTALERHPIQSAKRKNAILLHLALALVLLSAHLLALYWITWLSIEKSPPLLELFYSVAAGAAATNILVVVGIYAVGMALQLAASRRAAEQAWQDARLAALQMQLQPHLLFNTLNALAELVHEDPKAAERALLQLSSLLRRALDVNRPRSTLAQELKVLDSYLGIQSLLLGERLHVRRTIDAEALHCEVPALCLQTLVENAIVHGVSRRTQPSELEITIAVQEATVGIQQKRLWVRVRNPLAQAGSRKGGNGSGLANLRERLSALYGENAALQAEGEGDYFVAELHISLVQGKREPTILEVRPEKGLLWNTA